MSGQDFKTLYIIDISWRSEQGATSIWKVPNQRFAHSLTFVLLYFLLARTTKQTAQCQSVGDRLQKCVRLFRCSNWLRRKSILKLANSIFADLRKLRARKRENIWNIKEASHTFAH